MSLNKKNSLSLKLYDTNNIFNTLTVLCENKIYIFIFLGYCAWHHAAAWGRVDVLKVLFDFNADFQLKNTFGERARETALRYNKTECVDFLDWAGNVFLYYLRGARCSSVVRAFAHGAMGRRIDPSWGGPIELFLVPANAP